MADIRYSQGSTIAVTAGSIATNIREHQMAVVTVSYEPTNAANIRESQMAVVAPLIDRANAGAVDLSQIAIIVCAQELPWVPLIPPISLPQYLFSAIPYYVKR